MPLEQNVATSLRYKAHSTGVITANTESVLASDPAVTGGQELRRVTSTLSLGKDTYQSNEIATNRQISDFRHGIRRPTGEITGELSPGTYMDLIEAVFRATKVATFTKTQSDFTSIAATATSSKFTFGSSTWAAQLFKVGDVIRTSGMSVSGNNGDYLITALSTVDATVTPAPADQSADTTCSIARLGDKVFIPSSAHVNRKFLFEHNHVDLDISQLFSECRITSFGLSLPSTGLSTVRFGVTGRNMTIVTGLNAPFFTAPAASTATGIAAAVNGTIALAGTKIGILTGIEINQTMAVDAPAVVGQNFVPEIFLGRSVVTGTLTAFFQDETMLNYFVNETEVEIAGWLTLSSAVSGGGVAFFLPRVKMGGANIPLQGEGGLPITLPFQALLKATTTGYDATTMTWSEWTS